MKKKIIIISLVLALLTILTIGVFHTVNHIKEKKQYEETIRFIQEYYNNKVNTFIEENKNIESVDVVFVGDSLTDGCDINKYYSGIDALNRGISGDTTTGLKKRLKESIYDVKPKVVVMLIGGNNLNTMFDDYEDILIDLKSNLPSTKVILVSLTAMGKNFKDKNAIAIEKNKEILRLANKYNYTYVDIFSSLYDENTKEVKEAYVVSDGVHLTDDAYILLSSLIKPKILELLN